MDEQARLLYCVAGPFDKALPCRPEVTSSLQYPERQAYQLLYGLAGMFSTSFLMHAPDFRGIVERDNTNDLDECAAFSLNAKLQDSMRDLVKKYESMQAAFYGLAWFAWLV